MSANVMMAYGERTVPASGWRIRIVHSDAELVGAGWMALLLRELARTHSGYEIVDADLYAEGGADSIESAATNAVIINLIGVDEVGSCMPIAKFLRRHQGSRILNVVSSTRIPLDLGLLLRECGATLLVDSISSAKIASRTVGRFFDCWPLSTNSPMLQQLPWSQYSRHVRSDAL